VLIGFGNGIRGAQRLATSKAFGDPDNDMSCHARKYGMSRTRFQSQSALFLHVPDRCSAFEEFASDFGWKSTPVHDHRRAKAAEHLLFFGGNSVATIH